MTAFDTRTRRNRIETLIGEMPGVLPIPQDVRVSRLVSDRPGTYEYIPSSPG
jgi:hypothetical protein